MKNQKLIFLFAFFFLVTIFLLLPQGVSASPGDIYEFNDSGNWVPPNPHNTNSYPGINPIGIGSDITNSSTFYVFDANGDFYTLNAGSYSSSPYNVVSYPGSGNPIAMCQSFMNDILCVVDSKGDIYFYDASNPLYYKTNDTPYPGDSAANPPIDIDNYGLWDYVLDAKGDIYRARLQASLPKVIKTWNPSSRFNTANYPGTKPVALETVTNVYVLDANGDIYRLDVASGAWNSIYSPYISSPNSSANFVAISFFNSYLYILDSAGNLYRANYSTRNWDLTFNPPPPYPGSTPIGMITNGSIGPHPFYVLDGGSTGTLNVKVFNDKDGDKVVDSGEEFSNFDNLIAGISLDDLSITSGFSLTGDYKTSISSLPDVHFLGIDPNEVNFWQKKDCSFSDDNPCVYTDFIDPFYITTSFSSADGGTITVSLGIIQNNPPSANTLKATVSAGCSPTPLSALFTWNFSDLEGGDQSGYQIQVDDESTFSPPLVDDKYCASPVCNGNSQSYSPLAGVIQYKGLTKPYYWRLKVWDSQSVPSEWLYPSSTTFTTPVHARPEPEFSCNGKDCKYIHPALGEQVTFNYLSKCFDSNNSEIPCSTCRWDFGDGTPPVDTCGDVRHPFEHIQKYLVTLSITDDSGKCNKMHEVPVGLLPIWIEIAPY
jgi:hypothetical protein